MLALYVFIDTASFLLAAFAAIYFGNVSLPNPIVFVFVFFLFRTLLFYIFFQKILRRNLPLARTLFQGFILVVVVIVAAFVLTILPFWKISPLQFYFFLIPILTIVLSFLLQRSFKIEYWLR